jgi:hypothetical protein
MNNNDWEIKRFEECTDGKRFVSIKHVPTGLEVEKFYDGFVDEADIKKQVAMLELKVEEHNPAPTFSEITQSSKESLKQNVDTSDLTALKEEVKKEKEEESLV